MNETEFQSADGLVVCPLSLDRANFFSDYKLHHCHPDELKANGGICAACRKSASKANLHFKTNDEKPVEFATLKDRDHRLTGTFDLNEHRGYDIHGGNSEIVQIVDFDFDELDQDAEEFFSNASPNVRREAARAFGLILAWIWSRDWQSAQRKFAAFTAGLRPDLIDCATYEEIGQRLGCTKAAISKAAMRCQKKFNIKFTRSRSEESRAAMAAAQLGRAPRFTSKRTEPITHQTPPPV